MILDLAYLKLYMIGIEIEGYDEKENTFINHKFRKSRDYVNRRF